MVQTNYQLTSHHLYKSWFKEYQGCEVLEKDFGFMTYSFINDACIIHDMFVVEEYRGNKGSAKLADEVAQIAKSQGCRRLIGFVHLGLETTDISLMCQLKYGFKVKMAENNKITLEKEI